MSLFDGGDGGGYEDGPPTLNPDYWRIKMKQMGDENPAPLMAQQQLSQNLSPMQQMVQNYGGDPNKKNKRLGSRIGQGIVDTAVDAGQLALKGVDKAEGRVYDSAIDTFKIPGEQEKLAGGPVQHWDQLSGLEKFLAQLAMAKVPGLMTAKSSPVGALGPGPAAKEVMDFQNYTGGKWAGPASDITKLAKGGQITDEEAQRAKHLLSYLDDQNVRISSPEAPIGGTVKGDFTPGWRNPSEIRVSPAYTAEQQNGTVTHELGHHLDWDKALTNWTGHTADQRVAGIFSGIADDPAAKSFRGNTYRRSNPQEWLAENVRDWADKNFTPPSAAQNVKEVIRSINNLPIKTETDATQKILDQLLRGGGREQPSQDVLASWLDSILIPRR